MAWERIHRTVNANGGVSVRTGHSTETISLLDWNGANDGVPVRTSPIDIPIKGDILVLIQFSSTMPDADNWIRIEHSEDGTNWYTTAQHTVTARSTLAASITGSEDISKINYIDMSLIDANDNRYFFLYDIELHGMAKYTRFALELDDDSDHSGDDVTFTLLPHNF